ncbi:MAG: hydantoinase B/oxoprolinase family protein [Rhodospirillales bacterium]|nr:hydantoinase B/oxoprolinase family protein [Rhodospirillales bacterium]
MCPKKKGAAGEGFDPIAMEVFNNRLLSVTEDMGNTLVRSSFSTNIKERRDCSVGLFDARGRLIAQGSHVPLHLGSLLGSAEAVLERYSIDDMEEGDAFILNDPYMAGGTHMPDVSIVTPVFWDGTVRFFTANIGHHSDLGGSVPGSISATARSIFEEGLRIPVIRIHRAGMLDVDLMHLIVNNTREPEERELDLKVQIATNERGGVMVHELVRQMGLDAVESSIEDILTYTRRRLRNRIAELKDGDYSFTSYMDDDGMGGNTVPIQATVRVAGESLTVDFTGSGGQARGAMNVAKSALHATVYYCVKALMDPDLMPNSGMFDTITIYAPEGTITNPRFPAPVGARSITCNKVARAIIGAFDGLLPKEKVMAAGQDIVPAIVFSGRRDKGAGTFVYLETVGGGAGAMSDHDGMDTVQVHMTNTSNLPAEALEHEYALMVDEYAMVEDSGGAGTHRGGLGIARQISATQDGVIFSVRSDSHIIGSPGVFGGCDGHTARLVGNHGRPDEAILGSKVSHIVMKTGDSMRLETPGGGGWGPPQERALPLIAADVAGGKISRTAAERDYGAETVRQALADRGASDG